MAGISITTLIFAFIGGFLPTLIWLWYWIKQDSRNPEPKGLLFLVFVAGMLIVPLALPLEQFVIASQLGETTKIIFNSFIEEFFKLIIPGLLIFKNYELNEPIDYSIYLITAALGFAAVENLLFMLAPIATNNFSLALATGNLRFLGATVLHVVTVSITGILLGYNFKTNKKTLFKYSIYGLMGATILHTLFNSIIMNGTLSHIIVTMIMLWLLVLVITLLLGRLAKLPVKK